MLNLYKRNLESNRYSLALNVTILCYYKQLERTNKQLHNIARNIHMHSYEYARL